MCGVRPVKSVLSVKSVFGLSSNDVSFPRVDLDDVVINDFNKGFLIGTTLCPTIHYNHKLAERNLDLLNLATLWFGQKLFSTTTRRTTYM